MDFSGCIVWLSRGCGFLDELDVFPGGVFFLIYRLVLPGVFFLDVSTVSPGLVDFVRMYRPVFPALWSFFGFFGF